MKKIVLIAGVVLGGAIGASAQGLTWGNQDPGDGVVWHVYSPDTVSPGTEFTGNIAVPYATTARNGDDPTGTAVYTGVLIGGTTVTGGGPTAYADAADYEVALYGAVGAGASAGSLALVPGSTTTFIGSNTKLAGLFNTVANNPVVTGSTYGGTVTVQARAWYEGAGQYTSYAAAVSAGVPAGLDNPVNVTLGANSVAFAPAPQLQSFSLTTTASPEPSTIALGVMGASAFLLRRRMRK